MPPVLFLGRPYLASNITNLTPPGKRADVRPHISAGSLDKFCRAMMAIVAED